MALFDDVNRKLQALGNSVTAIGEAAQNKGAPLNPDTTPLSEWADAINNIPIEPIVWGLNSTNDQLNTMTVYQSFEVPSVVSDEYSLSTTFTPSQEIQRFLVEYCRKVVIPAYYSSINIDWGSYIGDYLSWAKLREIEMYGTGSLTWEYTRYFPYLQKVKSLTSSAFNMDVRTYYPTLGDSTIIDTPNAISGRGRFGAPRSDTIDKVVWNAPKMTTLGADTYQEEAGRYWQGDNTFPEVTTILAFSQPNLAGFTNTIRVPKLTAIEDNHFMWSTSYAGKIALYVGRNLSSIASDALGRIPDHISAGRLEFHIPAGDSTTKTFLDNNGISYIQDYTV